MVILAGKSWGSLLQSVAFVILFSCFVAQVWDSMDKFFSGKTTTAVHSLPEPEGGMLLPSIMICPGYRPEVSRKINSRDPRAWPMITYYDSHPDHDGPVTQTMVEQWWKNITFDITDFLREIGIVTIASEARLNYANSSQNNNVKAIIIDEVSSTLGRCYIVKSNISLKFGSDYMELGFDFTSMHKSSIALYVAPDGGELGLQSNYWLTDSIYDKVEAGLYSVDLALEKEETTIKQNRLNLCEYYTTREWFDCSLDWEKQQLLNSSNFCSFPQSNLVTRAMSPVPKTCSTKKEWDFSKVPYEIAYTNHVNPSKTGCPRPCHSTRYIPKKRQDITKDTGNFTHYYVYYHTTRVLVYEEYLLFDFGSIVSAVGGSLGLFLGFSCWQMVKETSGFLHIFSKKFTMTK